MAMTEEQMEKMLSEIDTPAEVEETVAVVVAKDGTALKRFIDVEALKRDVSINPTNLDSAMMDHASLYVHYAVQTVDARRQHERLKHGFEILEATLDAEYREAFATEGKKVTENAIRNALVADRRWSGAQSKVIEAQSIWKLCEVAESALIQRKDLILEVARDRRKEKEGQLRVLENQDMRERVQDIMRKAS